MLAHAFRHRSGRVIALSRLILAVALLLGTWLDVTRFGERASIYALLGIYLVWSAIVLGITWSSWWRDHKLAVIAHAIDIGAFGVIVFYTEGTNSPIYTLFVFLILSAAIRWSWRETAMTATIVLMFFVGTHGTAILFEDANEEWAVLVLSTAYLIMLSVLLMWFGSNQPRAPRAWRMAESVPEIGSAAAPLQQILELAQRQLQADRVVLAWWQREEPWLNVSEIVQGSLETQRLDPDDYVLPIVADVRGEPFLFDMAHDRGLCRSEMKDGLPEIFYHVINPALARAFDLGEGMAIRVRAREYRGELFAMGIAGLCAEDLWDADLLGENISRLFDRAAMLAVSEEAAVARAKASLARDLHDSVVQVLAGTSFRLEALRSWIKAGRDADPEINALKAELSNEQRKVRDFIAGLRSGRDVSPVDLRAGMRRLAEELKARWNIECELTMSEVLPTTSSVQHEIQQIVREAAANAKRHGGAKLLRLEMSASDDDLSIKIVDDGKGFPVAGEFDEQKMRQMQIKPWSVHERVKRLGGTLLLRTGTMGTELSIQLPMGPQP